MPCGRHTACEFWWCFKVSGCRCTGLISDCTFTWYRFSEAVRLTAATPVTMSSCCLLPCLHRWTLQGGLSKRVQLFLSDVETDTWSSHDLNQVVAASERVIITQGEQGAMLLMAHTSSAGGMESSSSQASTLGGDSGRILQWKIPAVKVGPPACRN